MATAPLGGRGMAGAPVAQIVGDRTEQHRRPLLVGQWLEAVEEGGLAVVATVQGVGDVARVVEFGGADDEVPPPPALRQGRSCLQFPAGQRGRVGGDGQRCGPQHLVSDLGEQGAVHPARIGDDGTGEGSEDVPEGSEPDREGGGVGVCEEHGSHHKGDLPGEGGPGFLKRWRGGSRGKIRRRAARRREPCPATGDPRQGSPPGRRRTARRRRRRRCGRRCRCRAPR